MQIITSLRDVIINGVHRSTNIPSLRDVIINGVHRSTNIPSLRDIFKRESIYRRLYIYLFMEYQCYLCAYCG